MDAQAQGIGAGVVNNYQHNGGLVGNRVHFQDPVNVNDQEIDVSEEARDFVHDLNGTDVPLQGSAHLIQESGIEYNAKTQSAFQRKINNGSGYRSQESVDNMHNQLAVIEDMREFSDGRQEDQSYVQITKFNINLEQSFQEFNNHVQTCNQDFKENIIR